MADDVADLVIDGVSRRVAMDIMHLNPKEGGGSSPPPGTETRIDGEVHDQEDLNGVENATLQIDGVGEFKVSFYSPTRFRGEFMRPWSSETLKDTNDYAGESGNAHE